MKTTIKKLLTGFVGVQSYNSKETNEITMREKIENYMNENFSDLKKTIIQVDEKRSNVLFLATSPVVLFFCHLDTRPFF